MAAVMTTEIALMLRMRILPGDTHPIRPETFLAARAWRGSGCGDARAIMPT
jgi:hypothetical protein